jgi:type II secretory pathway pseudopilin PulG
MKPLKTNLSGASVIEIIVAVGIFTIIAAGVTVLYLGAFSGNLRNTEKLQAESYLQQGLEAVRAIRDYNFDNLNNGNHGLSRASGYWEFSGTSEILGQFTRTVTINDVQRDNDCTIVDSGGIIDSQSKKVTVIVNWNIEAGNSATVSAVQYLNKWNDQSGCGESSYLNINVSSATLGGGDKTLQGITIQNTGSSSITISKITPTWTNDNLIEDIKMNGNDWVWRHNLEGVPDGKQASETELDIEDFTLVEGSGVLSIDQFGFDNAMTGASFTFLFTMSDGTARYMEVTPGSPPPDITAPDPLIDLTTGAVTANSVALSWTAPGDDRDLGTAASYDMRYSTVLINEGNWNSATQASGEPVPAAAGSSESMTISNIDNSTIYYFALKTSDEVPNTSGISNVPNVTTADPVNEADNLSVDISGVTIDAGDNTKAVNINLENTGGSNITIDRMTVSWADAPGGTMIKSIKINNNVRWTGNSVSGSNMDITDVSISSGTGNIPFDALEFSKDMTGTTLEIIFIMSDASTKTVSNIQP